MPSLELREHIDGDRLDLQDRVVFINRCTKVVKGGKNLSFSALVVVGDGKGVVGWGMGKAREVPSAISKGIEKAKKNLLRVPMVGTTIPHQVVGRFGSGRVLLKPAAEGTGLIAGESVRAVVESAGIRDILTKCIGTNNPVNVVKATVAGLLELRHPREVARVRGIAVEDLVGARPEPPAPETEAEGEEARPVMDLTGEGA